MYDGIASATLPIPANGSAYTTYTLSLSVSNVTTQLKVRFLAIGAGVVGTWWLDSWMLVAGSQPMDYSSFRRPAELLLCQRYYQKSYDLTINPGTVVSAGAAYRTTGAIHNTNVVAYAHAAFACSMRSPPSITLYLHTTANTPGQILSISPTNANVVVAGSLTYRIIEGLVSCRR